MTTPQHKPAQRHFVHQLIDWDCVKSRLERYPAIKRAFPLETLKDRCESPPYYCHYMAWRLGTWQDESLFQRIEELLVCAEALPNWEHERPLLISAEFGDFWSLAWQLQVAEHLNKVGTAERWAESGPDLSVKLGDERWFVECYTYRKSFDLLLFLEELLRKLDPAVCTSYDLCSPFRLPQNSDRTGFLHQILYPFLDPAYLENAKEKATQEYPVMLGKHPSSSLYVYVEGNDSDVYTPGIVPNNVGHPESYLKVALQEAVCAKQYSNELKNHHPNIVAVNYSLSTDYQVAKSLPERVQSLTLPEIEPNIDVLAASAIGFDERMAGEKLEVIRVSRSRVNCKRLDQIADLSDSGTQSNQISHSQGGRLLRKIYFDEDVDLAPLKDRLIGVIGYGNQGSAQARNLRDSGLEVIVGNRRDAYYQEAQRDGFPVFSIAQATSRADLVLVGIPDEIQQQVYERHMQKHIRGGQVLDFASSYGYRFKCIQPPPDIDVVMMSPRAMGVTVRELFVEGKGVPAFVAVGHDASGQARQIALALAKGVGCTRAGVLECTFQDEADVNLFGEQALWPLFNQALLLSYEVLVEAGVPPELVALEFYASGEAGEIFHKMAVEGMFEQTRYHSPTSQYGTLTRHEKLPAEEVKQRMKDTLRDIRNGRFAEEWAREQADGYPNLKRLRRQAFRHPLNRVEKNIRPLTPR